MKNRKFSSLRSASIAAAVALTVGCSYASGATLTWSGAGSNDFFNTAANWIGDVAPVANDALMFAGATRPTPSNNFAAGTTFGGIAFDAAAATFTVGGNAITLTQFGNLVNSSANLQTVNLPITLAAGDHTLNGGTAGLALPGGVTRGANSVARFNGAVNTTGLSNNSFGMIGTWATHGTDYAAVDGSGNIGPYTNFTELGTNPAGLPNSPGVNIRWTQGTVAGATPGTLTLSAGLTELNTFSAPFNNTQSIVFTPTTTLRFGAQGGILKGANPSGLGLSFGPFASENVGTITAGGADNTDGELFLSSAFGTITVRPVVADNGSGKVRVVSANGRTTGSVNSLSGHNTYTGGSYVISGDLSASERDSFGTGSVEVAGGARAVANPVNATTIADATFTNDFFIRGFGLAGSGGLNEGAMRVSRLADIAGTVNLLADSQITFRFANGTLGASISGKITGNAALTLGDSGANALFNINNSTNDWTGDTTLLVGSLRIGGTGDVIPNGAGKGDFRFAAATGTLNLNGRTETLNGLVGGAVDLDLHRIISTGAPGTLVVGDNNANGTFGPGSFIVEGTATQTFAQVAVKKIGSGEQVFAGNNTYTGVTTVEGGRLVLKNDGLTNAWTPALNNAGGADVRGGSLVFDYTGSSSPASTILPILDAGFDVNFATGQIRSSTAVAGQLGLGYRDENSQFTIRFTRYGDANLDGTTDIGDFSLLATSFNQAGTGWGAGDFNYDGITDIGDFALLAGNFNQSVGLASRSAVPEPTAGLITAMAAMCVFHRRR